MPKRRRSLHLVLLGALLLIVGGAIAASTTGPRRSSGHRVTARAGGESAAEREREREEHGEGYFEPRKEAKFERTTGEADRKGPENPAAEQVDNRAYPRSYVDDRRAVKSRKAFTGKPRRLSRSAFNSTTAYSRATKAAPGAWDNLGPANTRVPAEAGQFYSYATKTGPTTAESGRVTALAIDPNCGKSSAPSGAPCRLWVAAAGGGIWRTNDALAATPAWIAPPASLPTNACGSLTIDPNDATGNTLYAGSGEPNGSGDSEAGLGLFKSTNGGQSWQVVAGSQSVAT